MIDKIRSVVFNILFYGVLTPLFCICTMPSLLMSHRAATAVARGYQVLAGWLMIAVMGLKMEVRGYEHVPKDDNRYLVAAKHQSAYETMKLLILFPDPTIILKKELLKLPIFGWFLQKIDVIAIDRSNREQSVSSLIEGAKKMQVNNRPIVIFPQGTRVPVDTGTDKKPYKGGIVKLYTATGLPIVPMALNSGLYWPRNSFWKKSGTVIIEFLPPIPPGLPDIEAMRLLEEQIETTSKRLLEEGRAALSARGAA